MTDTTSDAASVDGFLSELFLYSDVLTYLQYFSVAMVVLLLVELAWDYRSGRRRSFREPLANISFQVVNEILERTVYSLVVVIGFILVTPYALFEIPVTFGTWILCLIATDFCYYWMHRTEHRVRFFWALHSVHHSSEEYDLSTSFRIFWLIDLSLVFFFIPLVLIGFSGPQVLVCMVAVFTYMIWVHTEKIGKLGWFDKVFSSPSVHRVHHGSNPQYLDKNYAGIFLIWDRLFGTYEPEGEKVRYGLTTPIDTSNPVRIGLHELIRLGQDLRRRKSWRDRLLTLVMPPDWKPAAERGAERAEPEPEPQGVPLGS